MANRDLLKQAIAEAKSVREAAIANAKEALEETLTPHIKDMLAAKLQEMEDSQNEEEVVNEVEEEVEEAIEENTSGFEAVKEAEHEDEAEDDSEESEDEAEDEIEEPAEEEEIEGDEDISKLTVDQFKDMIRDIIAQEIGGGDAEMGADMDGGDIEGMGDEAGIEEPAMDAADAEGEEEIDLDELIRELDAISEEEVSEEETVEEDVTGNPVANQESADHSTDGTNINRTVSEELKEALETIETLRSDLQEVNLLNSKLLYVNKIFKANSLTESQKVNVIAAFDKAETVKEVKLVFETVSENVVNVKKENVSESKVKGMASKATGTTASKPADQIVLSEAALRMQKLAGIIK